jgi:hypothetical protein
MKKISENDKGISTIFLAIIVVAVIAVAAVGAFLVLSNNEDNGLGTYEVTYRIGATIENGQTVYIYLDGTQIDENSVAGDRIVQATKEYNFKSESKEERVLTAELRGASGNVIRSIDYLFDVEIDTKTYDIEFLL